MTQEIAEKLKDRRDYLQNLLRIQRDVEARLAQVRQEIVRLEEEQKTPEPEEAKR